jgi:hypothetical protein
VLVAFVQPLRVPKVRKLRRTLQAVVVALPAERTFAAARPGSWSGSLRCAAEASAGGVIASIGATAGAHPACDKTVFFEFSLCLSRACLGKIIILMHKCF